MGQKIIRPCDSAIKESHHHSANPSKIGASVIFGRDRSACTYSAMKMHNTEHTIKNRNGPGEDLKSVNSNINRLIGDNKNAMENFHLADNQDNN